MANPTGINQYTRGGMGGKTSRATKSRLDALQKAIQGGNHPSQLAEIARKNRSGAIANKHRAKAFARQSSIKR